MVLAGPVAGDQLDVVGIGFIECGIINDQHTADELDLSLGLGPEDGGVGFEAMEQPRERIVGGRIGIVGLNLGRLRGGNVNR